MFQYLLYTILIETPVVVLFYRNQWKDIVAFEVLINCFTWPILTIFYLHSPSLLLWLELGVCIIESVALQIFFKGSMARAVGASFLANGCSLVTGLLISSNSML